MRGLVTKGQKNEYTPGAHRFWRVMLDADIMEEPTTGIAAHSAIYVAAFSLKATPNGQDITHLARVVNGPGLPAKVVEGKGSWLRASPVNFLPAIMWEFPTAVTIGEYGVAVSLIFFGWFLEYSDNGLDWVAVDEVSASQAREEVGYNNTPHMYWKQVQRRPTPVPDKSLAYKYWRIVLDQGRASPMRIWGVEILDNASDVGPTAVSTSSEPLKSISDNTYADNMLDGVHTTLQELDHGASFSVELSTPVAITGFAIHSGKGGGPNVESYPSTVLVQYSTNNKNWYTRHVETFYKDDWTSVGSPQRVEVTI